MISFYLPNRSSNECCSVSGIPTQNTSKCTSSFSLSDRIVEECVEFSENPETRRLKYEPEARASASGFLGLIAFDRFLSLNELENHAFACASGSNSDNQSNINSLVINQPERLLFDNNPATLDRVRRFMLLESEVKMVEFVLDDKELDEKPELIERIDRLLIKTQMEDSDHGSESASTGAEQAAETSERSGWNQGLQRPGADIVQTGASATAAPASEISQEVKPEIETGRVDDQLKAKD